MTRSISMVRCVVGMMLTAAFAFTRSQAFQAPPPNPSVQKLFEGVCSACHELERIKRQHLSKEDWRGLTKGMIDEGNALTKEEVEQLLDYLTTNFGPEEKEQHQ